ncbi:MAG TPA: hypothetical protein QGF58_20875 [Myxococcota bacterium]|nr:hypothetical protein [Myxococcota bacterium]
MALSQEQQRVLRALGPLLQFDISSGTATFANGWLQADAGGGVEPEEWPCTNVGAPNDNSPETVAYWERLEAIWWVGRLGFNAMIACARAALTSPGEPSGPGPAAGPTEWVGPDAAADLLGIRRSTLDRVVRAVERYGPPDLAPATRGTGMSRRHRVYPNDIETITGWWKEVQAWRASTNEARATRSNGGSPTGSAAGGNGAEVRPTSARRTRSSARSNGPLPSDSRGGLQRFVKELASNKR